MSRPKVKQWQDISTAPKDGTLILLFRKLPRCPASGYWSVSSERWDLCGRFADGYIDEDFTHWMPIPALEREP